MVAEIDSTKNMILPTFKLRRAGLFIIFLICQLKPPQLNHQQSNWTPNDLSRPQTEVDWGRLANIWVDLGWLESRADMVWLGYAN